MESKVKKICACPLNSDEEKRLISLLNPLRDFLGRPGDWGYGTMLADLTIDVSRICVLLEYREA